MINKKRKTNASSSLFFHKLLNLKWLLLLFLVVVICIWLIPNQNKIDSEEHSNDQIKSQTEKEAKDAFLSQKKIVDKYLDKTSQKDMPIVSYYSMAPLGILDPIYNPNDFNEPDAVINFLYGLYGKKFGKTEEELFEDIEFPLKHAANFSEFDYYNVNKEELNKIARLVETDSELHILGIWDGSNIYRVNNYFGDTKRNFTWQIEPAKSIYKYTINGSEDDLEDQNVAEKIKYDQILAQMSKMGVQSVYKCDGKIIFIMFAVSDNAFGYIYDASKGNDVNCGLLSGRFNILHDQVINKQWRYWVAN